MSGDVSSKVRSISTLKDLKMVRPEPEKEESETLNREEKAILPSNGAIQYHRCEMSFVVYCWLVAKSNVRTWLKS